MQKKSSFKTFLGTFPYLRNWEIFAQVNIFCLFDIENFFPLWRIYGEKFLQFMNEIAAMKKM